MSFCRFVRVHEGRGGFDLDFKVHTPCHSERSEESAFLMGKQYYVYLLASRSRNLYVGVTSDLKRRVLQHKQRLAEGFTARYKIHRLVHFEVFNDPRDAIACEKRIKSWRREKKVELISANNPSWDDLAAQWFPSARHKKQIPRFARDDS